MDRDTIILFIGYIFGILASWVDIVCYFHYIHKIPINDIIFMKFNKYFKS